MNVAGSFIHPAVTIERMDLGLLKVDAQLCLLWCVSAHIPGAAGVNSSSFLNQSKLYLDSHRLFFFFLFGNALSCTE